MALWNEPLDIICGGPEFFEQAKEFIGKYANKLNTMKDSEKFSELVAITS